jgi:hypothetical protein
LKIEAEKTNVDNYCRQRQQLFRGRRQSQSITGFIILVCGVTILWKSKAQATGSLSSTETEYIALCGTIREIKFISQLLTNYKIEFERPMKVMVENIGVIFLSKRVEHRVKKIDTFTSNINSYVNKLMLH